MRSNSAAEGGRDEALGVGAHPGREAAATVDNAKIVLWRITSRRLNIIVTPP
jgi:hypothetical protein